MIVGLGTRHTLCVSTSLSSEEIGWEGGEEEVNRLRDSEGLLD